MTAFRFQSVVGMTVRELQEFVEANAIPEGATIDNEGDVTWYE